MKLEDYFYDGPKGMISFNPKIAPSHFEGFFTTAEAWGNIKQDRENTQQKDAVIIKYGKVSLKEIQLHCDKKPATVKVLINNKALKNSYLFNDNMVSILFAESSLQANDVVEAIISY